jgi:hypothetical protein
MQDVQLLIPQHKIDVERAQAVVAAGYPAVAPILPRLLEWLQDYNWPVAQVLAPFLASIGSPLIPYIQHVLNTDDEIWKYWIISTILHNSLELATAYKNELQRFAHSPTQRESTEGLGEVAQEVLEKYGWGTANTSAQPYEWGGLEPLASTQNAAHSI